MDKITLIPLTLLLFTIQMIEGEFMSFEASRQTVVSVNLLVFVIRVCTCLFQSIRLHIETPLLIVNVIVLMSPQVSSILCLRKSVLLRWRHTRKTACRFRCKFSLRKPPSSGCHDTSSWILKGVMITSSFQDILWWNIKSSSYSTF